MTQRVLHLAKDLSLPLDAVTQTIAMLAKRRAGKSYTMRRLVEQLFKAGQQVVIVDPKGDQWGVRSAADGKGPGLPIVILGGERGDVPLEPSGGEVVAKLVVEERVSVLLDVALFRKHEVATFMTAFLENLYRLKAREIYRTPMMLVIDEADAIAPQKPQKGEERMLGAAEDIVRRGGQRGIGCVLVTQRSAVLNKNVLTQAQMLVALRTIAPQDLAAMDAWIQVHGEPEQRKTLMESLPSLPVGDAWFWSPGWPTTEGIFKRVHVLPIETFDSGATPKPGEKPVEPKHAADVDLDALKRQMAATIEKAKADDPRELRKQIAELKKQLAITIPHSSENSTLKVREKPILTETDRKLLERIVKSLEDDRLLLAARLQITQDELTAALHKCATAFEERLGLAIGKHLTGVHQTFEAKSVQKVLAKLSAVSPESATMPRVKPQRDWPKPEDVAPRRSFDPPARRPPAGEGDVKLNRLAERKVLQVLAVHGPRTKRQLAIQAGYAMGGGGFLGALSKLKTSGLIHQNGAGTLAITDDGLRAIGDVEPLPTGEALVTYWLQQFNRLAEREVLRVVVEAYPQALAADEIASRTRPPYEPTGGGFLGAVSKLRTLGLIDGRGELRASEDLFS